MALDYEAIWGKMVSLAGEPTYTPTPLSITSTLPSVIRQSGSPHASPDFPYITVNILDTIDESAWISERYVDGLGNLVHVTNKHVMIGFRCYSDTDGTARQIMNQLKGYLRFDPIRDGIFTDIGAVLIEELPVEPDLNELQDRDVDTAAFVVILALADEDSLDVGTIDTINIDGELAHYVNDPSPLPVTINII